MIRISKAQRKFRNARLASGERRMTRRVKRVRRNPEANSEHQEWYEGYSACASGQPRRSPYKILTRANAQWLKGYDTAKADMKKRDNRWFPKSSRYRHPRKVKANPLFKKKRQKRRTGMSPYKRGVLAGASAKKYGFLTGSNPYRENSNSYFKWQQGFEHGLKKGLPKRKRRKRRKTKVTVAKRNPSLSTEERELNLYAENDANLYRQRFIPIIKNLTRKINKGTYDPRKAPKIWEYYYDDAAKRYRKEFGSGERIFTRTNIRNLAAWKAPIEYRNIINGEYSDTMKVTVTNRNPRFGGRGYVVMGLSDTGRKYYYSYAGTLNTDVTSARIFRNVEDARRVCRRIVRRLPDDITQVSVERV